jgi:hypothetical protein
VVLFVALLAEAPPELFGALELLVQFLEDRACWELRSSVLDGDGVPTA